MALKPYRRLRVPLFWTMVVIAYVAAILPSERAPDLGAGDKINHIAAFFALTLVGRAAHHQRPVWLLATRLSLFGVLIELTQAIPILQRDASIWDWVADSTAILVGLLIAALVEKRFPALFAA